MPHRDCVRPDCKSEVESPIAFAVTQHPVSQGSQSNTWDPQHTQHHIFHGGTTATLLPIALLSGHNTKHVGFLYLEPMLKLKYKTPADNFCNLQNKSHKLQKTTTKKALNRAVICYVQSKEPEPAWPSICVKRIISSLILLVVFNIQVTTVNEKIAGSDSVQKSEHFSLGFIPENSAVPEFRLWMNLPFLNAQTARELRRFETEV